MKNKPLILEESALLVIDMQNYFKDVADHVLDNVLRLIELYRSKGRPVIFTYFAVKEDEVDVIKNFWGDSVVDGTEGSNLISELEPQDGEPLIRKRSYSSFHGTDLEEQLDGTSNLVICGVKTNLCCETAAREAFDRNFDVFLVMDACAAKNKDMHNASLTTIGYGFGTLLTTNEIYDL